LSCQNLIFNSKECVVLTCRDISSIAENAKLASVNKMLHLMSSAVSHEMVTPLKCVIQVVQKMKKRSRDKKNTSDC